MKHTAMLTTTSLLSILVLGAIATFSVLAAIRGLWRLRAEAR